MAYGVALADLEVPQAAAEGAEEGEDEDLDDDEPDLDPWGPAGLRECWSLGCLPLSVRDGCARTDECTSALCGLASVLDGWAPACGRIGLPDGPRRRAVTAA